MQNNPITKYAEVVRAAQAQTLELIAGRTELAYSEFLAIMVVEHEEIAAHLEAGTLQKAYLEAATRFHSGEDKILIVAEAKRLGVTFK